MKKFSKRRICCYILPLFIWTANPVFAHENVTVQEGRITNVRDPIDKTDVATKNYIDNKIEGIESPPVVLQSEGQSETATMSQKAITKLVEKNIDKINQYIDKKVNAKLTLLPEPPDPNDITLGTGLYIPANINLPVNDSTGILENKVVYNSDGSLSYIIQYWYRYKENESWKRTYNTIVDNVQKNEWTPWVNTSENAIFDRIYPVGSIYLSVSSVNPQELFGGTWTRWCQGRVPVGVYESENDFNAADKNGGSLMHRHEFRVGAHWYYGDMCGEGTGNTTGVYVYSDNRYDGWARELSNKDVIVNSNNTVSTKSVNASGKYSQGNTSASNTFPRYTTCYMWKRIA